MGKIVKPTQSHLVALDEKLQYLAANTPDNAIINGGGEVIDRTPEAIAGFVEQGGIWIDYAGYPMYYLQTLDNEIGASGWHTFLEAIGKDFESDFWANQSDFVYPRALRILDGTPMGFVTNKEASYTDGIYSSFAQRDGTGIYFYAYRDVPVETYLDFIQRTPAEVSAWRGALAGAGLGTAIGYGTTRDWKTVFGTGAGALVGWLIEKFVIRR